jgi:hypothetical protein
MYNENSVDMSNFFHFERVLFKPLTPNTMHKKTITFLAIISCLAIFSGCQSSKGTKKKGEAAAWGEDLKEDLQKQPPKWSNTGDEDVDALGEKIYRMVDGSHENMQQVYTKLTDEIPYNEFMSTLTEERKTDPDLTEDQLLQRMRDNNQSETADQVVAGRDAIRNRVNEASNFIEKTATAPEILEIVVRVDRLKAKLDSADFLMKAKLAKAFVNLTKGAAYIVHCRTVTRKINNSINAQNKSAKEEAAN